jgi:hypothetical protein
MRHTSFGSTYLESRIEKKLCSTRLCGSSEVARSIPRSRAGRWKYTFFFLKKIIFSTEGTCYPHFRS